MSKFYCPYNKSIVCDYLYRFNELSRQLNAAYKSGMVSTFYDGKDCACEPQDCPKYRDALPQMARKIKENQSVK